MVLQLELQVQPSTTTWQDLCQNRLQHPGLLRLLRQQWQRTHVPLIDSTTVSTHSRSLSCCSQALTRLVVAGRGPAGDGPGVCVQCHWGTGRRAAPKPGNGVRPVHHA